MKINIHSNSFHADEKLIDFTEDKVSRLAHFSKSIIEAQITLKIDKSDTNDNKISEIRLVIPGHDLFACKKGPSFEEAIIKTVEAVKQQLMR